MCARSQTHTHIYNTKVPIRLPRAKESGLGRPPAPASSAGENKLPKQTKVIHNATISRLSINAQPTLDLRRVQPCNIRCNLALAIKGNGAWGSERVLPFDPFPCAQLITFPFVWEHGNVNTSVCLDTDARTYARKQTHTNEQTNTHLRMNTRIPTHTHGQTHLRARTNGTHSHLLITYVFISRFQFTQSIKVIALLY